MEKHDVVIVGAGPAGLKAAEVLAAGGKDVLVLEKNDVVGPKVCAGGITLKDVKLGIPSELFEREFQLVIKSRNRSLKCFEDEAKVVTVSREKLGQWQKKMAECAGAKVRTGVMVKKLEKENNYVVTNKGDIGFDYLIGADGSSSVIRRELGIKTRKLMMGMQYILRSDFSDLTFFYDSKKFKYGYAWIFPHRYGTSVGCCSDVRYITSKTLRFNFEKWLEVYGIDVSHGKFEAFPINYDYRGFDFGNIFLVGDAAGLASGLTGEGIYFGLTSGEDVARRILNPSYNLEKMNRIFKYKNRHNLLLFLLQNLGFLRSYAYEFILFSTKRSAIFRRCYINYFA